MRIPQVTNTRYFEQSGMGAYLAERQAPLPAVNPIKDGSLGNDPYPALAPLRDGSLGKALGHFLMTSPLVSAAKAMQGLGDPLESLASRQGVGPVPIGTFDKFKPQRDEDGNWTTCTTVSPFVAGLGLVVSGIFSYQIGKAIAPSASKKKTYAMWAVPIGLLSPYLGMGCMALYAMKKG